MSSYKESDIKYETYKHFVLAAPYGYDVYRIETTHAVRCAVIGYQGDVGLERAKAEIARRESQPCRS